MKLRAILNSARLALFATAIVGCQKPSASVPASASLENRDQVTQVSIINALLVGHYDGVIKMEKLLQYGDFGLGTCDHLDGELIVLDHVAYHARADGSVVPFPMSGTTPFAVVTWFDNDAEFPAPPAPSLELLEKELSSKIPGDNVFVAIRLEADFTKITTRAVPRQNPPYRPLVEVTKEQTLTTQTNVKGTLIGLRSPAWVAGLNVPGYHWHFLSADKKTGGHVFDCEIKSGKVIFDRCDNWLVMLSEKLEGTGVDLSEDMSKSLDQVEKLRGDGKASDEPPKNEANDEP